MMPQLLARLCRQSCLQGNATAVATCQTSLFRKTRSSGRRSPSLKAMLPGRRSRCASQHSKAQLHLLVMLACPACLAGGFPTRFQLHSTSCTLSRPLHTPGSAAHPAAVTTPHHRCCNAPAFGAVAPHHCTAATHHRTARDSHLAPQHTAATLQSNTTARSSDPAHPIPQLHHCPRCSTPSTQHVTAI